MLLDREHLDALACPRCKGAVRPAGETLRCLACRVAYPVVDGIPMMVVSTPSSDPWLEVVGGRRGRWR